MTNQEVSTTPQAEVQTAQIPTGGELVKSQFQAAALDAIDQEIAVIEKAAKVVPTLIAGGMVPDRYLPSFQPKKNGPQQGEEKAHAAAMAAAVYGATLGMGVSKSLQNVFMVYGTPSIYARTAVALAVARGHEVWEVEASDTAVTVSARRRGSNKVHTRTFTMEQAKQAGFTRNEKYSTQPREMLYAKAAMNVCRKAFPDVLEGIPYSVEELELEHTNTVQAEAKRMDRPGEPQGGKLARAKKHAEIEQQPVDADVWTDEELNVVDAVRASVDIGDLRETYKAVADLGQSVKIREEIMARVAELEAQAPAQQEEQ